MCEELNNFEIESEPLGDPDPLDDDPLAPRPGDYLYIGPVASSASLLKIKPVKLESPEDPLTPTPSDYLLAKKIISSTSLLGFEPMKLDCDGKPSINESSSSNEKITASATIKLELNKDTSENSLENIQPRLTDSIRSRFNDVLSKYFMSNHKDILQGSEKKTELRRKNVRKCSNQMANPISYAETESSFSEEGESDESDYEYNRVSTDEEDSASDDDNVYVVSSEEGESEGYDNSNDSEHSYEEDYVSDEAVCSVSSEVGEREELDDKNRKLLLKKEPMSDNEDMDSIVEGEGEQELGDKNNTMQLIKEEPMSDNDDVCTISEEEGQDEFVDENNFKPSFKKEPMPDDLNSVSDVIKEEKNYDENECTPSINKTAFSELMPFINVEDTLRLSEGMQVKEYDRTDHLFPPFYDNAAVNNEDIFPVSEKVDAGELDFDSEDSSDIVTDFKNVGPNIDLLLSESDKSSDCGIQLEIEMESLFGSLDQDDSEADESLGDTTENVCSSIENVDIHNVSDAFLTEGHSNIKVSRNDEVTAITKRKSQYASCINGFGNAEHQSFFSLKTKRSQNFDQESEQSECEPFDYKTPLKCYTNRHVQSVYSHDTPYACEICDYRYCLRSNLKKHLRTIHQIVIKYACDSCGFKARHNSVLKRHVEIYHRDVKPYL